MVYYKCLYCSKNTTHKTAHNKHETICEINFNQIIEKYKTYNKMKLMEDFFSINRSLNKKFCCNKCDKLYDSYNGLKRHIKLNKCFSEKPIVNNVVNNVVNNTTNIQNQTNTNNSNTLNLNINNNIQLIPYDDIKYDFMKPSVLRNAFEIPGEAFQSITADTFFNPNKKENHVIFCPNLKDGQIHVYNGNKFSTDGWDVVEKKDFFKQMLINQMRTLEKIKQCNDLDDNPLEINNMVGFSNLLKEFNANNDVIKEYTTKLNTLCYKNNPIVKKTKDEVIESICRTKQILIK
jgi:hypothetical protein